MAKSVAGTHSRCKFPRIKFSRVAQADARPAPSVTSIWHRYGRNRRNIFAPDLCAKKALKYQRSNFVAFFVTAQVPFLGKGAWRCRFLETAEAGFDARIR